jgi:hypothetical protein
MVHSKYGCHFERSAARELFMTGRLGAESKNLDTGSSAIPLQEVLPVLFRANALTPYLWRKHPRDASAARL